ncbi:cytochrome c oxidase assembly protein [Micromonospora polyrhachis]|uniref:Putative membrane protein n=1 Tax=Micromonospora polyrhachis TaxID=1282883 RepID=A0A7W7SQR0_9ACTN|nr:cytochrome c oxidase assembly protein [Micromonospora polyrhachis]MBB4958826.1 putative membrane protein [Micromonospora polyrhachis]
MSGQLGLSHLAHGGSGSPMSDLIDLVVVVLALAATLLHLSGARRLRTSDRGRRELPPWRSAAFAVGTLVGLVSVSAPMEHLAEELFSAHMAQHLLLSFVCAPLVVLGRPAVVFAVALGHRYARVVRPLRRLAVRTRGRSSALVVLAALHIVPWLCWHVPASYDLAVRLPVVHVVEHVTLVLSGMVLIWLVLGRVPTAPAFALLLTGMATMGALAAVLAFGTVPLYTGHTPQVWDLTALEDQQLGGALMWFPGSLAYVVAVVALVYARLLRPRAALPDRQSPAPPREPTAPPDRDVAAYPTGQPHHRPYR